MISRVIAATSWALHARGISPTAWKVLMVMAHMINNKRRDFDIWPRQKVLAEACDMPLSTLKRHINELEEKGFLVRRDRMRKHGGVGSCTYTLNVKASFEMPENTVTYDFEIEDEDDGETSDPLAQYELARSTTGELARSTTGELAIEPLNPEPLNPEQDPTLPTEGPFPVEEKDLFGSKANLPIIVEPDIIRWIEAEWTKLKEEHPRIAGIRKIDDGQAATIRQRAKQHAVDGEDAFAVWRAVFHEIRTSRFLLGYVPPKQGQDRPFKLSLNWLCAASKFRDVINGKFSSDTEERFAYRADGSPMGPGDQTAARAIERRLARRQQQRRG